MALSLRAPPTSLTASTLYPVKSCGNDTVASSNLSSVAFSSASSLFPGLKISTLSLNAPSRRNVIVRAEVKKSVGLARKGIQQGGRWLSCTTRHIRIYVGVIDPEKDIMDQSQMDTLSLILDPDGEFLWPEETAQRVYDQFAELVENYAGADLTEYTLRLIGSDLEHFIRQMLLDGEIQYNLDCRVLNFSMGKPRVENIDVTAA